MKPKLYCIGRIGRILHGKLVIRRRIYINFCPLIEKATFRWTPNEKPYMTEQQAKRFVARYHEMFPTASKALARWQMKQWRAPSKLKVKS